MQQLYKQCRKSNGNFIKFSLSNANKGAVGLIPALKLASLTQTSPFKENYRQDPRMGFEGKKKKRYKEAEKFVEKMKKNTRGDKDSANESTRKYEEVC